MFFLSNFWRCVVDINSPISQEAHFPYDRDLNGNCAAYRSSIDCGVHLNAPAGMYFSIVKKEMVILPPYKMVVVSKQGF